jgi:general stress protein 26
MTQSEFMREVEAIIEESKTAVLATVDKDGNPHVRWMTPVVLKEKPNTLFATSSPDFSKIEQIKANNNVEWLLQTRSLDRVIKISGKIHLVEEPGFKAEVMQAIGPRLRVFWTLNDDPSKMICLETEIISGSYFTPINGKSETVSFNQ